MAGNEAIDEDVDIVGGNDLPMSSFPPVEIEKDAVRRNSKCRGPSSSSSESGSSSSGSCFCKPSVHCFIELFPDPTTDNCYIFALLQVLALRLLVATCSCSTDLHLQTLSTARFISFLVSLPPSCDTILTKRIVIIWSLAIH